MRNAAAHASQTQPASTDSTNSSRPSLSASRKWLFRLAAVFLAPTLFVGLLELVLRLSGYGYSVAFFVRNPVAGQNNLVENREFSRRYFTPELMRIPKPVSFSPVKSPRTLRIFVFGESAAEGDPAPAFGFARILQVLLCERYPDQKIEVINTAVTAVNSHVIRPIAHEAADYGGDFWVIYLGNNEVVGPFGSGTVFSARTLPLWMIRASIALKTTRTGQLLDAMIESAGGRSRPQEWQGMEMFLSQQIRQVDPRLTAVYEHFAKNLSEIIASGVRSGAKVVVSTVGSNLRDCAPLGSLHGADFSAAKTNEWETLYHAGVALEDERHYAEAAEKYEAAAQLDDQFADLHFRLARCFEAVGKKADAQRHFALARDLDTLRFRADSRINAIIRSEAETWQPKGVRLADVEAALARESVNGIPGKKWFYEHVHMTFEGNYLAAREIAEQIVASHPNADAVASGGETFLSREACAERLGLTDCERLHMAEEMSRRTSRPPFTRQLDHAAQRLRWDQILADLRGRDRTNFLVSAAIYQRALADQEDDWLIHDNFAGASLLHGDWTNALTHWERVVKLLPHRVQTYDLMGSVLLEQRRLDEASACCERALRIQPDFVEGLIGLGRTRLGQNRGGEAIEQFQRAAKLSPGSERVQNHLGVAWLQLGSNADAEAAFRDALRCQPDFEPARLNLSSALLAQGKGADANTNYQAMLTGKPGNVTIRMAYAKALAKQDKLDDAIEQYAEAARLQPDDFETRFALGNALIKRGRIGEAAEHFAAAIRLRPDSAESHLNYGSILASQGKTMEAREEFEQTLRLQPDFASAHLNLATALSEQNELSAAITHLREVLRLEPGNKRARQLLEAALSGQRTGFSR